MWGLGGVEVVRAQRKEAQGLQNKREGRGAVVGVGRRTARTSLFTNLRFVLPSNMSPPYRRISFSSAATFVLRVSHSFSAAVSVSCDGSAAGEGGEVGRVSGVGAHRLGAPLRLRQQGQRERGRARARPQ